MTSRVFANFGTNAEDKGGDRGTHEPEHQTISWNI